MFCNCMEMSSTSSKFQISTHIKSSCIKQKWIQQPNILTTKTRTSRRVGLKWHCFMFYFCMEFPTTLSKFHSSASSSYPVGNNQMAKFSHQPKMDSTTKRLNTKTHTQTQRVEMNCTFSSFTFVWNFLLFHANFDFQLHAKFSHRSKMDSTTRHLNTETKNVESRTNRYMECIWNAYG